jgi:hypothetical protein
MLDVMGRGTVMRLTLLLILVLSYCLASVRPLSRSAVRGHTTRLRSLDAFNHGCLSQAYFNSLEAPTVEDAVRFEALLAWIASLRFDICSPCYFNILSEAIEQDRLECFVCFYPLVVLDGPFYLNFMDMSLRFGMPGFAEHIIFKGDFTAAQFFHDILRYIEFNGDPRPCLDLIDWVAERDAAVSEAKSGLCYKALFHALAGPASDEVLLQSTRRLIEMGLLVDDALLQECRRRDSAKNELYEFLYNKVKEPEC